MKNRYLAVFLGIFIVSAVATKAQEAFPVKQHPSDKPFIFTQLPERSICIAEELQELFRTSLSAAINIHLTGGAILRGVLAEKIQRSPGMTTINIKLSDYPGTLFNISLNEQPGHLPVMIGRIIHPQSGDVLVLIQENSQYYLQKKLQKFFMIE